LNALKFALTSQTSPFPCKPMVMSNRERVGFHQEMPAHCCLLVHDTSSIILRPFCGDSDDTKEKEGLNGLRALTTATTTATAKKENTRSNNAIRTRHVQWLPRVKSKSNWPGEDIICNHQSNQPEPIFVPGPASGESEKSVRRMRGKVDMREDLRPIIAALIGSQRVVTWNWP
jgi:hypothetical protein